MEAVPGLPIPEDAQVVEEIAEMALSDGIFPESLLEPINPDAVVIKPIRHVRSHSDCTGLILSGSSEELRPLQRHGSVDNLSSTTTKPRFLEDGGSSIILPSAGEEYPMRKAGQSVEDYLLSNINNSSMRAELDRENSHFTVSETMIAAIEETLFTAWQQRSAINEELRVKKASGMLSTETILPKLMNSLCSVKKPRVVRRIFASEPDLQASHMESSLESTGQQDAETPEMKAAPQYSSLQSTRDSGISFSALSLNSVVDEETPVKREPVCSSFLPSNSCVSAEAIALSLLEHFSEIHLPKLNELDWLVSEEDAPQHLLPMPKSWPISPDDGSSSANGDVESSDDKLTPLRGNWEWAPPRAQVVFALYNSPNLKVLIAKQNYRCAGCGVKVRPEYCKAFRFCNYLGRYFCTSCHSNKSFFIPSRILKKWDFKKYPVSNFSLEVLERLWDDPLFNINYANPFLYRRYQQMNKVKELRVQLCHLAEYLKLCRYAASLWEEVQRSCLAWLDEPHTYSLRDLVRIRSGELYPFLRPFVQRTMEHVIQCLLCRARGFFCEICKSEEVIFPFQLDVVSRCDKCGSCHHINCLKGPCPRCQRLSRRSSSAPQFHDDRVDQMPV